MVDKVINVLFLGRGNIGRSIIAESILNRDGGGRFKGFSAGAEPAGAVHPAVLALLRKLNHPTAELHSKEWQTFATPDAPQMDFVFTVCDSVAGQSALAWPGQPLVAHWGIPDPLVPVGSEAERAVLIADTYRMLTNRIGIFTNLPLAALDRLALQQRLHAIGQQPQG
ncbi:MAG TPA: arsenate reductase ArsC [Patescibacteria group bacterium]|nr:arsenate reductase ArsC [Patescibacteria group bacterium]